MSTSTSVTSFFSVFPGERLVAQYEVVNRPCRLTVADFVLAFGLVFLFVVPAIVYIALVFLFRKKVTGYMILTDQRLGFYERSSNVFGAGHLLYQVNLENVMGIVATYGKDWGNERVMLDIMTSYGDGFSTVAGKQGSVFSFLRKWLPSSLGKDVYTVQRSLYSQIDNIRTGREVLS
jgi:hypothetical protein